MSAEIYFVCPDCGAGGTHALSCAFFANQPVEHGNRYISVAAVRDMLESAYHPQLGENPTHPADMLDMWVDPCGQEVDGERCILVSGHAGPHKEYIG